MIKVSLRQLSDAESNSISSMLLSAPFSALLRIANSKIDGLTVEMAKETMEVARQPQSNHAAALEALREQAIAYTSFVNICTEFRRIASPDNKFSVTEITSS